MNFLPTGALKYPSYLEWDNGGERDYDSIVAFLNEVDSDLAAEGFTHERNHP